MSADPIWTQAGLVALGAFLGFGASFATQWLQLRNETRKENQKLARLARVLYEEVEQVGELVTVDLDKVIPKNIELILDDAPERERQMLRSLARVATSRILFDANATELANLPRQLPSALVRYHNRLQVNCDLMERAIMEGDSAEFQSVRVETLNEVEVLKFDLLAAAKEFESSSP